MSAAGAEVRGARYIDTVETAKIIRATLKAKFPEVRWSVRVDKYSMGSSVDVFWTDGPTVRQVDEVTAAFAGKGFDGMIDLSYYRQAWLLPDGTARFAHTSGTAASRGSVPEAFGSPMHPDAELVEFGADYVMTHREISPEFRARIVAKVTEALGEEPSGSKQYDSWKALPCMREVRPGWGDSIVQQVISRTATKPSDWVPEWRRPKPKSASKPNRVLVYLLETPTPKGYRMGYAYNVSRRVRHGHGFYYKDGKVTFWKNPPKYIRAAVLDLLTWATGREVTE